MDGIKSGLKTSEFWISAGTTAWALLSHTLPPVAQTVIGVGVPAVYTIARALVKASAAKAAAARTPPAVAAASPGGSLTVGDP
jgi:hypothetical protein